MIEEVGPDSPCYQRVIELGNACSATLGLLPYAAIHQAAAEGRVLAFIDDDVVKGLHALREEGANERHLADPSLRGS